MKRSVRKGPSHVHVTYKNHGYSNSLHAENFTIDANEERVLWSMDFALNGRKRNKDSNCCHDVKELEEDKANVAFFQMAEDSICSEIIRANSLYPDAVWTVEILFERGSHRYEDVGLEGDRLMVQINVAELS